MHRRGGFWAGYPSSPTAARTASTTAPDAPTPPPSRSPARGNGPYQAFDHLAQAGHHGARPHGRCQRRTHVNRPSCGEYLDGQNPNQPIYTPAQLPARRPAHGHVVLLHRRRRNRICARRSRITLQLRHNRSLRILRNHVAGIHARIISQKTHSTRGSWRHPRNDPSGAPTCSPHQPPQ